LGDISAPFSTPETIRKSIEKTGKNGTADHSRDKPDLAWEREAHYYNNNNNSDKGLLNICKNMNAYTCSFRMRVH
jgi:hypothetical protein